MGNSEGTRFFARRKDNHRRLYSTTFRRINEKMAIHKIDELRNQWNSDFVSFATNSIIGGNAPN